LAPARELAGELRETDSYINALHVLWFAHYRAADARAMSAIAREIESAAAQSSGGVLMPFAQRIRGTTENFAGDQVQARLHLERAIEETAHPSRLPHTARFAFDNRAAALGMLAITLWLQGLPDRAVATAQSGLDEARASGNAIASCHALLHSLLIVLNIEHLETASAHAAELMKHAEALSADVYRTYALASRGVLIAKSGDPDSGLALLQPALNEFRRLEHALFQTLFGVETAAVLGRVGRAQEGHAVLDELLGYVQRGGPHFLLPELLRIKGELEGLTETADNFRAAETTLSESIDCARRQGALAWELRATTSLALLKRRQHRKTEAIQALAPVYAKFHEGFNTGDLKRARALLGQLNGTTQLEQQHQRASPTCAESG
jgi:predicted ATPase